MHPSNINLVDGDRDYSLAHTLSFPKTNIFSPLIPTRGIPAKNATKLFKHSALWQY